MRRLWFTITGLLLVGLLFLVGGLNTSVRGDDSVSDPFIPYADLLNGNVNQDFSCVDTTSIYDEAEINAARQLCTYSPATGIFSQIRVIIGEFYQVEFTPRSAAMTIGDIAKLWGRPQVGASYRGWMPIWWSGQRATAGVKSDGSFSYFLPIERITFTTRGVGVTFVPEST